MLRLVPDAWEPSLTTIACDPALWSRTGRALLFELKTYAGSPGRVNLSLLIGPAASEARTAFYQAAASRPQVFRGLTKSMGSKWVSIFSEDLLTTVAAKDLTLKQQAQKAAAAWAQFQATSLPALVQAVLDIDAQRASVAA